MNEIEAIKTLKELQKNDYDTEANHRQADGVLAQFLESLGYNEIVEEFYKIERWYG